MASETTQMISIVVPQFLVIVVFFVYVFMGTWMYPFIDDHMNEQKFSDLFMFVFSTVTTIGYGNITPKTNAAQLFTMLYATIGIALSLLAVSNIGKYIAKCYWIISICFGRIRLRPTGEAILPWKVMIFLLSSTLLIGILFADGPIGEIGVQKVYLSVVSFATVGFGDKVPNVSTPIRLVSMIIYLTWGLSLLSTLMNNLDRLLHSIRHKIRPKRFQVEDDFLLSVDGATTRVSRLLDDISRKMRIHATTPQQLRRNLRKLQRVIDFALPDEETGIKDDFDEECSITCIELILLALQRDDETDTSSDDNEADEEARE